MTNVVLISPVEHELAKVMAEYGPKWGLDVPAAVTAMALAVEAEGSTGVPSEEVSDPGAAGTSRDEQHVNISGYRISTTEVESALVSHPSVAEAAVVGANDDMTRQGIVAFVILRGSAVDTDSLVAELKAHVAKELGPIAQPKRILVVPELPKTRSGKIMRRLLRDIAENRAVGDATTPQDSDVLKSDLERAIQLRD